MARGRVWALAGAAAGLAAGVVAERVALNRRRADDPEADQEFGSRRGDRSRKVALADGARLFVEEIGPESTSGVVFVHGSVLRTDVWHYQMSGIGGHRLVFYDLRGHGLSQPKGEAPFTLETHTKDLEALIDECGLDEVVIVGHSVGGMVVLELCEARRKWLGKRIKGIVLLNTTFAPAAQTIIGGGAIARIERATRRPFDLLGKQHERIDVLRRVIKPTDALFWSVALGSFGPQASAKQVDFVYDMLAETPAHVIFDLIKSYRDYDMTDRLEDIDVPALVVGGTHDRLTRVSASRYLAEHLPQAHLKVFDNCGHMAMLERHQELNEMLEGFLADTLGTPGLELAATKTRRRKTT